MADYKKFLARIILLMAVAVILTLCLASLALAKRDAAIYPSNIFVGGVSMAGLDHDEAADLLAQQLPANHGRQLLLQLPSRQLSIPLNQVGIAYDIPATLAQIDDSLNQKGFGVFKHCIARGNTINIAPKTNWNRTLMEEKLAELKQEFDQPAVNARILYSNDYLEYIGHKTGYAIDIYASLKKINHSLQKGSLGPVPLITTEIHPRVKLEDIKEVKDMIGISMSRINLPIADLEPLVHNLNGFIIMPADSFSLNLIILPKSMIFTDSSLNLVNDTLRRALSQAGLKYVEQQAGFINNLEHPVLVTALIDGNNLIIKIFGCQTEEGKEILFVTEKKEIPPQMQVKVNKKLTPQQRIVIQEGQSGYINRSYRVVKIKGKETEKTLLSEELTPGWDTIIAVGPGTIKK
jgi:vancomycin resistance protein YoaR